MNIEYKLELANCGEREPTKGVVIRKAEFA
jgi:hypothetical protein